jgi:hypothetical protein
MFCETVKDFCCESFMKNNLFLIININMNISIYIECALGGVLCGVLCSALCGVLLGNCSTPPSTPKKNSILIFVLLKKDSFNNS